MPPSVTKIISKRHLRRRVKANIKQILNEINANQKSILPKRSINENFFKREQYACGLSTPTTSVVHLDNCNKNDCKKNSEENDLSLTLSQINDISSGQILNNVDSNLFLDRNVTINKVTLNAEIHAELENFKENLFLDNLKIWSCRNNITHKALNELIGLIRPKYPFLKLDARSVLDTPRHCITDRLNNGEMIYFGVEIELKHILKNITDRKSLLFLQFNIDGISPFNNSSFELWPILGKLSNFNDEKPFVIAVFCGKGKPSPIEIYLEKFINEMKQLLNEGFIFENQKFNIEILFFSCDAPARAFLKQIKGHTSKNGCERCVIESRYGENKKHFYPVNLEARKRKDDDFLQPNNDSHFKAMSPLLALSVGLVSQFVLDPMHLVYLGVVRRLLQKYWVEGRKQYKIGNISLLDQKIKSIKFTDDFGRKLSPLSEIRRWKAVECRNFLLYCAPFLLKNHLNTNAYKHFLNLHVAITILSCKSFIEKYFEVARNAVIDFVNESANIYDKYFVVYNVHSLTHICDDVQRFGPLESFSCFDYENLLGKIKKKIRGTNRPLQQLHNRLKESRTFSRFREKRGFQPKGICGVENSNYFQCKYLFSDLYNISTKRPDNFVMVDNNIIVIKSIYFLNGKYHFSGTSFKFHRNLYNYPIDSSKLSIFFVRGEQHITNNFLITSIQCKCFAHSHKDGYAVFPILHTLQD